jgi:hypothetical protein
MCGHDDLVIESKAEFYGHLPVIDFVILDITPSFDNLEPVNIVQRLSRFCDRVLHRVFDTGFRRAGQLNRFVDVLRHDTPQ